MAVRNVRNGWKADVEGKVRKWHRSEMQLYTLILDYAGGTYLAQVEALDAPRAVEEWIATASGTPQGVAEQFRRVDPPVALEGLKNAWCATANADVGLALLNIVATSN